MLGLGLALTREVVFRRPIGEILTYSDGEIAWDLMRDAATYGEESTVAAIDQLHTLLHTTLTPTYW